MSRFILALFIVMFSAEICHAAQPAFPLKVSGNGRYLVDQNGVPFPIWGDAGWETSHNLTPADQTLYLTDRTGRGFTAVLQEAIDHKFNISKPPKDIVGNLPFTTRLDGAAFTGSPNGCTTANGNVSQYAADPYSNINAQAPDFTFPNETYWTRLDSYLTLCAQNGVVVLLFPAYVGYAGGDEGWMQEMTAIDAVTGAGGQAGQPFADNTKSKLWNYGAWLANRYKSYSNIIWVHGGDYGNNPSNGGAFTTAQKNAVNNLFAGMKSVAGQLSVLHTAHWSRRSTATDISFTAGTFDIESTYADASVAQWGRTGYAHTPAIPSFEIEDYYEANSNGTEPIRHFAWWAQLSNIAGYFYSSENVWPFDPNIWKQNLNTQGAQDCARQNAFMKSIAWQNLVPSGLNGMKNLVTAGGGTANPQSSDYVSAAATPDGTLLVAYVPPAHSGTMTVDMTAMIGTTTARWFNPTTAAFTAIGTFPNTGSQIFTPPGNNGTGFTDWVLILTASVTANNPPTVATAAAANPNPVTATTTALSVLGADDGGEPALTYSWSTVGTPPASVTFSANGSNAAKSSTATFSKAGSYTLRATITDAGGLSVTSDVAVTVNQTLKTIVVAPPSTTVSINTTQQFTATANDQFGNALTTQPSINWSVSGGGAIAASGLFTAGSSAGGPFTVTATSGAVSGTASVTVSAGFAAKINFQISTTVTPTGYLPDIGLVYGDRGNGFTYGWNVDNTAQARERNAPNSPDKRYDTFNQMQRPANPNAFWEIAVPNGNYSVRLVSGDPSFIDSVYAINAEATLIISGTPTSSQLFFDNTATIAVSDGRLTISSATGSTNNKINFIEITAAGAANQPPTVATAAAASPNPVTGTTSALSVLGADDGGEAALVYSWSVVGTPPAPVTFSANGTNAAKNSTATFTKSGSYALRATITDTGGLTATSNVTVTVNQTLTSISVSPATASVAAGGTQTFAATANDQFAQTLTAPPTFTWTVSGGGTISTAGVFTAGASAGGPFTVNASSGGKSGTASVTVTAVNHPPTITSPATATPNPANVNQSVAFSVGASDPDADPLTYAWTFGDGASGSGATPTHAYTAAGSFTANVTVTDGRGGSVGSSVTVTVNASTSTVIKINFQLASTVTPAGYLPDSGLVYGDRGNGYTYGWNADSSANARERFAANSPDKRYDTFIHMQKPTPPNALWEIAVPNGDYSVRIVAGDPSYFDSVYMINAEGVLVVNGTPTATVHWIEGTQTVTVADGRLTISSAAGSVNNKLTFVEITTVALRDFAASSIVADAMQVNTLIAKMSFAKANQDGYSVSGTLPTLGADFKTVGVAASIDVGAAIVNFTLDAKGRARGKQGSFNLKYSKKSGWQFKASLSKGAWSGDWSDAGLYDQTVKMPIELPVTLTLSGHVFGGSKTVQYTATAHKSGTVK